MSDPQPAPPAAAQAVADAGRIEAAAAVLERRYPAARPEMLDLTISELHSIARVWRRMAGQPAAAAVEPAAPPVAAALDPKHLQAALEALSAAVAGAEYEHQRNRYKAAWAALDALEGKDGTEGDEGQ